MNVESTLEQQIILAEKIKKSYANFKKDPKDRKTVGYLESRLELLQQSWTTFTNTHSTIFAALSKEQRKTLTYFSSSISDEVEEVYEAMYISIKEHLQNLQTQQVRVHQVLNNVETPQTISRNTSDLRLPRIRIECFSGNYEKWVSFRNLYTSLIHDKTEYTAVEKFYYLKANVSGEASRLISQYTITNDNYTAAWEKLIKRYDNKRILVNTAIRNLFMFPKILHESAVKIRNLLDVVAENLQTIKGLEIDTATWSPILIYILVQKLDAESGSLWEHTLKTPREIPTMDEFSQFLESRFQALENLVDNNNQRNTYSFEFKNKSHNNSKFSSNNNQHSSTNKYNSFHSEIGKGCIICSKSHRTHYCPKFFKATPEVRKELIKRHMGCFNCLQRHQAGQCPVSTGCKKCGQMHSTFLHFENKSRSQHATTSANHLTSTNQSTSNSTQEPTPSTSASVLSHAVKCRSPQQVLLATALVHVPTRTGTHTLRCLIDQGSESSFITTAAVQRLGLKKTPIVASIMGIASTQTEFAKHIVNLKITSIYNHIFETNVNALVLSSITGKLPSTTVHSSEWQHIIGLDLADPEFHQIGHIDVLLGADIYGSLLLSGIRKGPNGSPVAQKTELGWILSGPINLKENNSSTLVQSFHNRYMLDDQIKKLWLLDEISTKRENTREENECEQHFLKTFRRTSNGRFLISLPFQKNYSDNPLGESRGQAVSRFLHLERKFKKNPEFYDEYKEVIMDYIKQNHMYPIDTPRPAAYYMPHHAVIKEHSTTSRLRVVFDASAKTTSGASLNDKLLIGPTIQEDLVSILMRWRTHLIVFSADITKMYRQIRVQPTDTQFQRIIWRDNPKQKLKEFELQTVTFGTAPASFLAIRCLQQLAHEERKSSNNKQAAEVILNDFYVDDLMTGASTLAEANHLKHQIKYILGKGGFELRKFVSNNGDFLAEIPADEREVKLPLHIGEDKVAKTLGMHYFPAGDYFQFKVAGQATVIKHTKRSLLSITAKLFDPLGWLAPVIITAKILFQELWLKGLDWDQDLPQPLLIKWECFVAELQHLQKIKIPRCIGNINGGAHVQIHGFSDASQSAYAAVVYARVVTETYIKVTMLASKTRVAPIKPISIPRLELCGALLLASLIDNVNSSLRISNATLYAWTDSTIVLGWLKGHPSKYKTFVANRIVEIHDHLATTCWRHVKTEDNPADSATRGILPSALKDYKMWWQGPEWLSMPENNWCTPKNIEETYLEIKTPCINALHITVDDDELFSRYSNLIFLLRVTAWCLRFLQNIKKSSAGKITGNLTAAEIQNAKVILIKKVQTSVFHIEYEHLKNKKLLPKSSKILAFNPFIDKNGVLRIGGRLQNATLSYDEKHPAILPSKNKFTQLVINHAHIYTLHGGVQTTMAFLRRHIWIIKGRNEIRKCIHQCVKCFRFRARGHEQIMGDLPKPRIQISIPFTNVGVDYAGPLDIKASGVRNIKAYKGYIALFICLATKAVHLEVVSEQTSAAFLAAFNRFVARRGLPSNVYSDNGTNFVGANRHLQDYRKAAQYAANLQADNGVQWHFIPPRSPHFGGLWEAGIKSTKGHLKRIVGNCVLTFEELTTVLSQIEACLNSRPLCPMTSDHQDLSALTPGHFLVGRPLIAPPNSDLEEVNINRLRRWRKLDKLHQHFWKRWSTEYVSRLQQRPKWGQPKLNIKVGDLVLLKEDNQPPLHWPLGRVVNAIPGKDGYVRVVDIRTSTGNLQRTINKVCLLPVIDNYVSAKQ